MFLRKRLLTFVELDIMMGKLIKNYGEISLWQLGKDEISDMTFFVLDCDVAVNALDFSTSVPFLFDRYYVGKNIPVLHPFNFGWIGCVFVIRSLTSEWLEWEQFEGKTEVVVARFVMSRLQKEILPLPQLAIGSYYVASMCVSILYKISYKRIVHYFPKFYTLRMENV